MKVVFDYKREKDIWSLINFGKKSGNSGLSTKIYEKFVQDHGENLTEKNANFFIEKYISENNLKVEKYIRKYQEDWDTISDDFQKRAEKIFGVSLSQDVIAYLSVNSRCPYNIEKNYFFVSFPADLRLRKTTMHELWHFYTWYKFGVIWEEKIGKQKYQDIKEAFTVLLNVECKDLFPKKIIDEGYSQHQELREKIMKVWLETKDIDKVWDSLI